MGHVIQSVLVRALALALCLTGASGAAAQTASRWVNIGPAPIVEGTSRYSGRVTSIAVDPHDPKHWLIGAALGGIWETRNGGGTWAPRTDDQRSLATGTLAIGAISFAPGNPAIVYAGTGEPENPSTGTPGIGVYKSTDGGRSWQLLPDYPHQGDRFVQIKVSPNNANFLVAATSNAGIVKSTDGGRTWPIKLPGNASDLAVHEHFASQYAAIWGVGVYRSLDAGDTWNPVGGPWTGLANRIGRVKLAIAPSDPNIVYVSIHDSKNGGLLGIWRSIRAWEIPPCQDCWIPIVPEGKEYCERQCDYNHDIIVDPSNQYILYGGWVDLWKFDGIYLTWDYSCAIAPCLGLVHNGKKVTNGIHTDQHRMAWAGNRMIVGNDGGVWSTIDGGSTWTDHNSSLSITQLLTGSLHPTNPNFILAGSQDNGGEKFTGTTSWEKVQGGDGSITAISPTIPDAHWAASHNYVIWRTTNGGNDFHAASPKGTGVFAMCPANEDVFIAASIAAGSGLIKSTNFFSAGTTDQVHWESNGAVVTGMISAMAFAPWDHSCNTYVVGTSTGELWVTFVGGGDASNWNNINQHGQVPSRYVTRLAFDPTSPNILYVTLSGSDANTPRHAGHVFKTTQLEFPDPGWLSVTLPVSVPANTVAVDPLEPNLVYVGSDVGVWKSTEAGASWTPMGPETGMPIVSVWDLKIHPTTGRVVAFTFGRGAFVLDRTADLAVTLTASPNPVSVGSPLTYTAVVSNYGPDGTAGVTLNLQLPGGVTLVSAASTQGACSGTTTLMCTLDHLRSGRAATVSIMVIPRAIGGTIQSRASVSSVAADSNPANNATAVSTTVVGPDLLVVGVGDPPGSTRPSNTLTVTDTVQNTGTAPAATSTTRYYLSRDGLGRDYELTGSRPVPALAPSQSSTGTASVYIPGYVPGGSYYLLACADGVGALAETNESNNCRASHTRVGIDAPLEPTRPGCRPGPPGGKCP